ncbi:MAG: hypothetical protein H6750_08440 [Nitrospiraceae bacterium]|nr:hypothetical protein [Nitrospira sp.]MCA9457150.1 hypothetical protein [Nitrospira sp.]MCB9774337.1 hypothetical protein [Nitrospiraceae bacterium]
MPLNETLVKFLQETAKGLGHFCQQYETPLRAFLAMVQDPEDFQKIEEVDLSADYINSHLDNILSQDDFLRKCCGDKDKLAHVFDILFFSRISDAYEPYSLVSLELPNPNLIAEKIKELDSQIYGQGSFEKKAYFHLFNFCADPNYLPQAPYPDWTFEKLGWRAKAQLLGEVGYRSFLSPPGTGDHFLVVTDHEGFESESLDDWLNRRMNDCLPFLQVLQYAKDAIIDIDYVVPHFNPPWVNQLQRGGLPYLGTPRKDEPSNALWYYMLPYETELIQSIWLFYKKHEDKILTSQNSLRKAIRIAGAFYEDSHKKINRIEQFANLIIALEALYTPSDQAEHTFRISQSCAVLLEETLSSRESTFEFLRAMFKKRGKLFHGQYDLSNEDPQSFISDEDLTKLIAIVRISILKFLSLLLNGENNLNDVRKDLERAILDEIFRPEFLKKTNYELLIHSEDVLE